MVESATAAVDRIVPDIKTAHYAAGPPKEYDWDGKLSVFQIINPSAIGSYLD